jgi:hypothetical protein
LASSYNLAFGRLNQPHRAKFGPEAAARSENKDR